MKIHIPVLFLIVCGCLAIPRQANAGEGDVAVGGELLFTIKAASGGKSIAQRVDAITERLPDILSDPHIAASDIYLVPQKDRTVRIMVRARLLVTVTVEDGRVNQKTPLQQAQGWLSGLRRVIPRINVKRNPNDRP